MQLWWKIRALLISRSGDDVLGPAGPRGSRVAPGRRGRHLPPAGFPRRMIDHKPQILLAPALSNSSCWRSLAGGGLEARWESPGVGEILRAALILTLSLGILGANLLVICVINSRRYHKYIHAQVSLANQFFFSFFFWSPTSLPSLMGSLDFFLAQIPVFYFEQVFKLYY